MAPNVDTGLSGMQAECMRHVFISHLMDALRSRHDIPT